MEINKKKSAILEFVNRRIKKTNLVIGNQLMGFPIVREYKYLGTWLNQKLDFATHAKFLLKKCNSIRASLSPTLYNASLDLWKNLWQTFIVPLYEFILPLYFHEKASSNKLRIDRMLRNSFRCYTGLKKGVSAKLIQDLMGYDLQKRSAVLYDVAVDKWQQRFKSTQIVNLQSHTKTDGVSRSTKEINLCKYQPKEMVKCINMQSSLCPKCQASNITHQRTINHLKTQHNIQIQSIQEMVEGRERMLKPRVRNEKEKTDKKVKVSRKEKVAAATKILEPNLLKLKSFLI